jgi:tRNA G18 (ribose-2'-O)-methylase SpoU
MPVIRVEHIEDPRLNDYRNVSDGELLRRRDLFVAEGRLVVRRLLSSRHRVVSLLMNEPSFNSFDDEFGNTLPEIPVYVGSAAAVAELVGFNFHRGCMALARRPADISTEAVVNGASLLLVLERVTDADNVGGAFRNAAAFGVDGVLLSACCDPLYRKAVRTSMGHVLQMPHARLDGLDGALAAIKTAGFIVVALTPDADAIPLADFTRSRRLGKKIALLAGNEAQGLTARAEAAADVRVRIPMHRGVDSLNLSTAIGIALDRIANP